MIPKYFQGEDLETKAQIQICDEYGEYRGVFLPAFTKCEEVRYKKSGTEEKIDDDLVLVKVTECPGKDHLVNQEVWIKAQDFNRLGKDS